MTLTPDEIALKPCPHPQCGGQGTFSGPMAHMKRDTKCSECCLEMRTEQWQSWPRAQDEKLRRVEAKLKDADYALHGAPFVSSGAVAHTDMGTSLRDGTALVQEAIAILNGQGDEHERNS